LKSSPDKSSEDILPAIEGRFEVMLGLALEGHAPEETHPSLEDIAGWYDQTLPKARSRQVKAHVARCQECYAVWFGLVECGCGGAVEPAPGLFARAVAACANLLNQPRAWGLVTTGLAAVGVTAAYLFASGDPAWLRTIDRGYTSLSGAVAQSAPSATRWSWGRGLGARGMDNPWERLAELRTSHEHEAARAAFGVGVRAGLSESLNDTSDWTPRARSPSRRATGVRAGGLAALLRGNQHDLPGSGALGRAAALCVSPRQAAGWRAAGYGFLA
jgi:hypothetical protein